MKRWWVLCLSLILLLAFAETACGEPEITEIRIEDAGGVIEYPRLDGHPDAMVQSGVNQLIVEKCGIDELAQRLKSPFVKIEAAYHATLKGDVLSVLLDVRTDREQYYKTVTIDLKSGEEVSLNMLFADYDNAIERMENICVDRLEPNVSSYLENGEVLPLPMDNFYLNEDQLILYYNGRQFSYFSGYSGSVSFFYYELADYLRTDEEDIPARMGIVDSLEPDRDAAKLIAETAASGCLPGIAPKLYDDLSDWLDVYRLLCDPDYYPGGRFFQTEAGEMRDIWLLTDDLTDNWDESRILGIRADRVDLYGIRPGITVRDEVEAILGEPETQALLDEYAAMDYYLDAGTSAYYTFGSNMLRMHYDEDGMLVSVQLLD